MVKTSGLERLREKRIKELQKRRPAFNSKYNINEKELEEMSKIAPPQLSPMRDVMLTARRKVE